MKKAAAESYESSYVVVGMLLDLMLNVRHLDRSSISADPVSLREKESLSMLVKPAFYYQDEIGLSDHFVFF